MKKNKKWDFFRRRLPIYDNVGVTLLELVVVVLILGLLSTIAVNVFSGQVNRAKIAASANTIRELDVAITRYEIDTGFIPPSGSATVFVNNNNVSISSRTREGNGLLYLALAHSLNGNALFPLSPEWQGPYIEFNEDILGEIVANAMDGFTFGRTEILDSFNRPFVYVNADEYDVSPFIGTRLFSGPRPAGADPELPGNSPFAATETFYNPTTWQIYSNGPNGSTSPAFPGAEFDDINNF